MGELAHVKAAESVSRPADETGRPAAGVIGDKEISKKRRKKETFQLQRIDSDNRIIRKKAHRQSLESQGQRVVAKSQGVVVGKENSLVPEVRKVAGFEGPDFRADHPRDK